MDPITGVVALTGLTVAALAGLRLKKQAQEGFAVLQGGEDNGYDTSVAESETKYNPLMSMVNPIMNPILPGGASEEQVKEKQQEVNQALGSLVTPYDPSSPEAFKIKDYLNRLQLRKDSKGGLFNAIKFCRDSAKATNRPFTTYKVDDYGNVTEEVDIKGREQKMSDTETFKFDEICGVCLTSGIDEDGNPFNGRRGMLMDPSVKRSALREQDEFMYPFPRVNPSMGKCEGAPNTPAFAIDDNTLQQFVKRIDCLKSKEIKDIKGDKGEAEGSCGLCFETNTYSYIPNKVQKNSINLVLMGVGKCDITADNTNVKKNIILDDKSAVSVPLILNQDSWIFDKTTRTWKQVRRILPVNEGMRFVIEVTTDPNKPEDLPIVWGYIRSANPNGGEFAMPLNLIITRDDETNSPPNRTGGFHKFPENDIEASKIRPGGQTGKLMKLSGVIPFTFTQASEFPSFDCPSAPFQTKASSVTSFATDQPCYAKGSGPGNYNDECLRERILAVGCTNNGKFYKDPQQLNKNRDGGRATLTDIYNILQDTASKNMLSGPETELCSGNIIESPCDIFMNQPSLKLEKIIDGSDKQNARMRPNALKCLSYLYNNRGAQEANTVDALGELKAPRIGPTYTGLNQYANDNQQQKKLYCLPAGQLNPEQSNPDLARTAAMELARMYDMGFRGEVGVNGVKAYLNSVLQMAIDERRNGNTDPDRRSAIRKCFGTEFNPLVAPTIQTGNPSIQNDPPKYVIRDANNRQWRMTSDKRIRLSQGNFIEVDFVARPDVFKAREGRIALFIDGNPAEAIRHSSLNLFSNPFVPNNFDWSWYPLRTANNTVTFYNDFEGGYVIGYDGPTDSLTLVRPGDSRAVAWRITPYPSSFAKEDPSLLIVPRPTIRFAWYGSIYRGIGADVTNIVQNAFNSGASQVTATDTSMGGDPVPNTLKRLWIDFTAPFDQTIRQFVVGQDGVAQFSQLTANLPVAPTVTAPQLSLPTSFDPSPRRILGTAWSNGDYELIMDIWPSRIIWGDWGGIVQFTATGGTCCNPGDRIPALWFIPSSLRIHVRIGDMTDGNWGVDTATSVMFGRWNRFVLRCRGREVSVTLNNEQINVTQPTRRPRGVATVWTAYTNTPAGVSVANFSFRSL